MKLLVLFKYNYQNNVKCLNKNSLNYKININKK
jgi:hypothetical protein